MDNIEIYKSLTKLVDTLMDIEDVELSTFGDIKFEVLHATGKVRPKVLERDWVASDAINVILDIENYLRRKYFKNK